MHCSLKRILGLILAVSFILTGGLSAAFAEDATEEEPIYVLDYFDGTALDLTQYEGKAVFLNFFTQWCHYCMEEMPDIKDVYDMYDPESLIIILVHPWNGEDADDSAAVVAKYGLEEITLVEDVDLAISTLFGLQGYPTSIFIDQDGYFYGYAYAMDFESFSEVFDSMGVPKRDDVEEDGIIEETPSPDGSVIDATTKASSED